jgi:hypothetical protein
LVGEFNVPMEKIDFARPERAIREINPNHLAELIAGFRTTIQNGLQVRFPPATGVIFDETMTSKTRVELIDGNHTHHVLKQLSQLYPEKEELKTR